jgi:hypothetical protein
MANQPRRIARDEIRFEGADLVRPRTAAMRA